MHSTGSINNGGVHCFIIFANVCNSSTQVHGSFATEVYCYGRVVDVRDMIRAQILGAIEITRDGFGDDFNRGYVESNVTQEVQVVNGAGFIN